MTYSSNMFSHGVELRGVWEFPWDAQNQIKPRMKMLPFTDSSWQQTAYSQTLHVPLVNPVVNDFKSLKYLQLGKLQILKT